MVDSFMRPFKALSRAFSVNIFSNINAFDLMGRKSKLKAWAVRMRGKMRLLVLILGRSEPGKLSGYNERGGHSQWDFIFSCQDYYYPLKLINIISSR